MKDLISRGEDQMCFGDSSGGNGQTHPHAGNKFWYEAQEEQLHKDQDKCDSPRWWFRSAWMRNTAMQKLMYSGVREWIYWVTHPRLHEATCRWARTLLFAKRVLIGRY